MAQCEKILDSGERCSNQAVPGTRLCQTHTRITFRPVKEPADTAPRPEPAPPRAPSPTTEPPARDRRAVPSPAGREPAFPGLHSDERNILVAPQGLIWLPAEEDSTAADQFNRLVRLMGFLSQALVLPGQVRLLEHGEVDDLLLLLSPAEDLEGSLSGFYDAASSAARLVGGGLYIGQEPAYVQYRDDRAPRGYDLPDFKAPRSKERLLRVARWGSRALRPADFDEIPLGDFCLRVAPLPDVAGPPSERVYALVPSALYLILARYFRAHHLHYGLARLHSPEGELILFEVSPRPDAPAGNFMPPFVLDYLARLPRLALLTEAHQSNGQRILLQWRHRFPLSIPHVADAFAPDDTILLVAEPYANQRVNPRPLFFDGDQLIDVHIAQPESSDLTPHPADETPELRLPVLLRPDHGPTPPIAALILTAQEVEWVRQFVYRLPGDAFGAYSLCIGQDRAVLVGGALPVEGLPFGLPLRQLSGAGLFVPLRSHLVPDLPWSILRQALDLRDDVYTFLTGEYRLDLPVAEFAPLSRALLADPDRPTIEFNLRPVATLPDLRWKHPPAPPMDEQRLPSRVRDLLRRGQAEQVPREGGRPTAPTAEQEVELDMPGYLRRQARAYEEAKDFLAAAVCYSLLNDVSNSARCYRQAAALSASTRGRG